MSYALCTFLSALGHAFEVFRPRDYVVPYTTHDSLANTNYLIEKWGEN
jgi:hypothetical protein